MFRKRLYRANLRAHAVTVFTEERARWLYRHYRWLETHLPGRSDGKRPVLILPTPEFYPVLKSADHAFASALFERTRSHMGLDEWPCELAPQLEEEQQRQAALRSAGVYGESKHTGAAGTFSAGQSVRITYSPNLLRDPVGIVGTFAHELCHYLLATVGEEPPSGWAEHEPLTDLAAVHEGFGIFLANSAFQFSQWSDSQYSGWQSEKRGYLTEAELGFALGIFCVRTNTDPKAAGSFLKLNPGEVFWDSIDYIRELEADTGGFSTLHAY